MNDREITGPIRDENPCLDCHKPKRYPGCHGKCKEHAKWKAEIERVNKNRREYEKKLNIRRKSK